MLGKIIKYDIKATARYFIPLYVGLAIITLCNKLFLEVIPTSDPTGIATTIQAVFMFLYVIFVAAAAIMNFVILVVHFYRNMTGDEAYLTFTLPVKTSALINSKILVSALWTFLSSLFTMLSISVLLMGHGFFEEMNWIFRQFMFELQRTPYRGQIILFITLLIIALILSLLFSNLVYYASISLGHLFGKYRVLGSIVCYVAFHVVTQIIMSVIMVSYGMSNRFTSPQSPSEVMTMINQFMAITIVFTLVTNVIYYVITNYVFSKKLNLE